MHQPDRPDPYEAGPPLWLLIVYVVIAVAALGATTTAPAWLWLIDRATQEAAP